MKKNQEEINYRKNMMLVPIHNKKCHRDHTRLRAKKGPAPPPPPPPLGNFADISYLEENFKPHLLRDVCTLCSGALVSDSLLHMLLQQTKEKIKMKV